MRELRSDFMERAFLVTKDSNYYKDMQKYVGMVQK